MSYLEKLLIKGIRSYNPNDSNTIEFSSPMTLIVGANGTGKTTIIECLKYITTGNLPPNSKGGAFVYDARLAREVDVKAQVKLSFTDKMGKKMVVSRTIQCTQKGSKVEQKTLESVVYEEGRRENPIVLKSGENELMFYFDVPLAMLDSVIFCHQEESTWPVSEPANVKKKFDEILSSSKYSKALESLKVAKRNTLNKIKLKYQELEFLYKIKEKKNEIEMRLHECIKEVEIKERKENDYAHELETCEELLVEISKDLEKINLINLKLNKKKEELESLKILEEEKMCKEEAEEILKFINFEKLKNEIDCLKLAIEEKENLFVEIEKNKKEFEEKEKEFRQKELLSNNLKGELEAEKNGLVELAGTMKMKFTNLKENESNESLLVLDSCALTNLEEIGKFFEMLFRKFDFHLENKKTVLKESKEELEHLKDVLKTNLCRLRECEREISECNPVEDDPSVCLEDSFSDLIGKLKNNNFKEEIANLEESHNLLQFEFQKELKRSKEAFEILQKKTKIESIKKEINFYAGDLKNEKRENKNKIEKNNLKIKQTKEEILETLEKRNKIEIYKEMLKGKTENLRKEMERLDEQTKKKEIKVLTNKIEEFDFKLDFNKQTILEDLNKEIEKSKKKGDTIKEAKVIYGNILKVGLKKKECPICCTTFKDFEKFKERVENLISKMPEINANKHKKLEDFYALIKFYKDKLKEIEQIEQIKVEHNQQEEELISQINLLVTPTNFTNILEELELTLLDLEEENAFCERKNVLLEEIEVLEKESKDCKPVNLVGIEKELEIKRNLLRDKKKQFEELKIKIRDLEEKQIHLEKVKANREIIKKKQKLEEEFDKLKVKFNENRILVEDKENILKRKESRFEVAKENLCKSKIKIEHKLSNAINKKQTLSQLEEDLKNNSSFNNFNFVNYESLREDLYNSKTKFNQLQFDLSKEKEKQEEAKKHVEHFKNKEISNRLRKEIQKIKNYFTTSKSIESHFENLTDKKTSLKEKRTKIIRNKSLLQGEINQLKVNKNQITVELQKEYGKVVEDYNKAYLTHKILELTLKDLDKLINVLDKAILDFHSLKIEEVNKILKELWSSCYKGNDIDFIELKSESLSNKTYSYRISQIKNGVELEMRGRCSAGQRMLASILIRLALSQTFGTPFNVLALDEPTTNLDRENIESLAHALIKIMNSSRDSKFQLIVITHDEEFVSLLTRESSEYFYRLSRNERGDSQIHRHSIY